MNKIYFEKKQGSVDFERLSSQIKMATQLLGNGRYEVKLTKYVEHRSTNQNRLLMLWCNCIAKHLQENSDVAYITGADVKEMMKLRFLAIDTPLGKAARHTSKLTTEEMTDFLNAIQAYFQTISGVMLPQPNDLLFDEFERQFSY